MRLCLVQKEYLTPEQLDEINELFRHSIKLEGECGPIKMWKIYQQGLYAFITLDGKTTIAVAEASGRPVSVPGWWVDPKYRGQGYGKELVDLLAPHLRKDGVTTIGNILIQTPDGKFDAQSRRLVIRLQSYFQ